MPLSLAVQSWWTVLAPAGSPCFAHCWEGSAASSVAAVAMSCSQADALVRQSKVLPTNTGSVAQGVSCYEDGWGRLQGVVSFWSKLPVTPASCTLVHIAERVHCDCSCFSIEQPWRFYQRYKPGREIRLQTHDKSHIRAWEYLVQNNTLNVIWIETSRPQVLEQWGNQHQLLQFTDLLLWYCVTG